MSPSDVAELARRAGIAYLMDYEGNAPLREQIAPLFGWRLIVDEEDSDFTAWHGPNGSYGALPSWFSSIDSAFSAASHVVGPRGAKDFLAEASIKADTGRQVPCYLIQMVLEAIADETRPA